MVFPLEVTKRHRHSLALSLKMKYFIGGEPSRPVVGAQEKTADAICSLVSEGASAVVGLSGHTGPPET